MSAIRPAVQGSTSNRSRAACSSRIFTALILDAIAGWWSADPLAAGVVAIVALNEAREAFKR
jgi:divalent metal cation (Fe/Co/Zn/Cd) transporter